MLDVFAAAEFVLSFSKAHMRRSVLLLLIAGMFHTVSAQTGRLPVQVTDLTRIRSASQVKFAPGGDRVVFTVTAIQPKDSTKLDYDYQNQIWIATPGSGESPRQLTFKEGSWQADISPDGKQIAFVRLSDSKPQIFLMDLNGGEARQLTHFKYGAGTPQWSADGKQILFPSNIPLQNLVDDPLLNPGHRLPPWPFEKPGIADSTAVQRSSAKADPDGSLEEIRKYLQTDEEDKVAKVVDKLDFQDESGVSTEITFNHFFLVNVDEPSKWTQVTPGYYRFSAAAFVPGSKRIIVCGDIDSLQHPDRSLGAAIYTVNPDGTGIRTLAGAKGWSYNSPVVSPDGRYVAVQYSKTGSITIPQLAILPVADTGLRIEIPFDRNIGNVAWSDDSKAVYFTAQTNGVQPLYRAELSSRKIIQLTDSSSGILSFDVARNRIVYVKTQVDDPFDLYGSNTDGKEEKRISDLNYSWVSTRQVSVPEKHVFTNSKGQSIEYWIMKPANFQAGKKYPLLLEIHGGPTAMWGPGESTMWHEFQFFCGKGYGVVYCNPRGSGGYGLSFMRANINDWGAGPTSDVLTAVDKTIASQSWVDTSKLLVTGGSYGGYLVAYLIGHDHRFKAACSQRGVYDLATFFGEGNAWRLVPYYFGGYPWEPATKATLTRESPINYVPAITTPYLIFHGEADRRTGTTQGEMMFRSLKVAGRPVEYVRHPGATHEITRSGNNRQRIDQMLRTYEFFERWIGKKTF